MTLPNDPRESDEARGMALVMAELENHADAIDPETGEPNGPALGIALKAMLEDRAVRRRSIPSGLASLDLETCGLRGHDVDVTDIVFSGSAADIAIVTGAAEAAGLALRISQTLADHATAILILEGPRMHDVLPVLEAIAGSKPLVVIDDASTIAPSMTTSFMDELFSDETLLRERRERSTYRLVDDGRQMRRMLAGAALLAAAPMGGGGFDYRTANRAPRSQRRRHR